MVSNQKEEKEEEDEDDDGWEKQEEEGASKNNNTDKPMASQVKQIQSLSEEKMERQDVKTTDNLSMVEEQKNQQQ